MPALRGRTVRPGAAWILLALVLPTPAWTQQAPPGFQVQLLAQAPEIEHPSTVTCDDEGNLFVGEDPMDMRGPSTQPIDRILYLRWDRAGGAPKKTVFCDRLSAVFGMVWHQKALYVLHAPYFSVFRDTDGDGVADVRVDLLTNLGHPAGKFGLNNHQPTGLQLGMDGWMYISVGDKGIPRATGKDGSTITLEGGGIIRLRPDGTRLEVVSSGVRNHLDLALDARDNVFGYDNDDDLGWPTQLFHHFPTAYFGYPYYQQRFPGPRLSAVSVHGKGVPCGAACYREAAWPARYRERLFFGNWGKGTLECVTLERRGASFVSRLENFLVDDGSGKFRPIDLCFSPDGKHLYVADWNVAGGGTAAKVGRLFRVTYVGRDVPPEPPRARDTDSLDAQLRALAHPARHERLRAQQRLAALGETASAAVEHLLASDGPTLARSHALWTLAALAQRVPRYDPAPPWLAALRDPDAEVRAQAARALGDRRVRAAAGPLARALKDRDAAVRLQAAIALGRLGRCDSAAALLHRLDEPDRVVRFAIIQALRALNHWEAALPQLRTGNRQVRDALVETLAGVYDPAAVETLAQWTQLAPTPAERALALEALALVHRRAEPYTGGWWGPRPAAGKPGRPKIHPWTGTSRVEAALAAALEQTDREVRLAAVQVLREVPLRTTLPSLRRIVTAETDEELRRQAIITLAALEDRECAAPLLQMVCDGRLSDPLRHEAIRAVVALRSGDVAGRLDQLVRTRVTSPALVLAALDGLASLRAGSAAAALLTRLDDPHAAVRRKAVEVCVHVLGKQGAGPIAARLKDPDVSVRRAAVEGLGRIGSRQEVPALLAAAAESELRFDAIRSLAAIPDARALRVYLDGLEHKNAGVRKLCRQALAALDATICKDLLALHQSHKLSAAARRELQTAFAAKRTAFAFLFESGTAKLALSAYADFAARNRGDTGRGRQVFADLKGVGCSRCHAVRGEGAALNLGPDLAGVGSRYPRAELIRSVLDPSNRIIDGYELTVVTTTAGRVEQGILKSQTREKLVLLTAEGQTIELRADQIEEQRKSKLSPMPAGLVDGMTLQDFADLIAYLESLKDAGPPATKSGS